MRFRRPPDDVLTAYAVPGRALMVLSILTRFSVLCLLCVLALWTEYLNLKVGYNNARLVELASGPLMRHFYELSEGFFSWFGDPLVVAQSNAGMTWSIRLFGVPFTDPVALLSVIVKDPPPALGFTLGALIPLTIAVTCGRVFCSYVCPASLLFFTIGRVRRLLSGFFYFPELKIGRGLAWGLLAGTLIAALPLGYGVWTIVLPYFAMGQTIFHSIALGTLSVSVFALILFALLDLFLGYQFTCRYICPTGRLLGFLGRRSLITVNRDADQCIEACTACGDTCPFQVNPKLDETIDCSLCGECTTICPSKCLDIGPRR